MELILLLSVVLVLSFGGFQIGRRRAEGLGRADGLASAQGSVRNLHSLAGYHGAYVALWCGAPALLMLLAWVSLETTVVTSLVVAGLPDELQSLAPSRLNLLINDIRNLAAGNSFGREPSADVLEAAEVYKSFERLVFSAIVVVVLALSIGGILVARTKVAIQFRARNAVERIVVIFLIGASGIAILTTIGIVFSLIFEAVRFFQIVPIAEFLFGLEWSPQIAMRSDQVASDGAFGAVPIFAGTLLISTIAMMIATPVGLFSAIYMSEYANPRFRAITKPLLEILAGIPTVVYGFFAALTLAPFLRDSGSLFGLPISSESALAAGIVMGVMIIPFVSSLSDDVISAVPRSLREASYGLGATKSETIIRVVLPAALPGIVGSLLLAASRAIGETMIVVMAAGLSANLTANPFAAVTTVTVQIVTLLTGDQEFDSAKTLAAFALGLTLFVVTLCLNVVALRVVQKYQEKYD